VAIRREAEATRFSLDYNGAYGSLNNLKNTNTHRANTALDYYLTRRLILTAAAFEGFTDEFQNIKYRLTPNVSIGYYLFRRPAIDWILSVGPGYQHVKFESVRPGEDDTTNNAAVIFKSEFDAELTSRLDLLLNYQLQFIAPDTEATNHHGEGTLSVELTSAIDLDFSLVWDHIEKPERDSDGDRPDTDDFRTTIGLAIDY
jgi:hypothetical protein